MIDKYLYLCRGCHRILFFTMGRYTDGYKYKFIIKEMVNQYNIHNCFGSNKSFENFPVRTIEIKVK